jgi:hypothetical protein
MNADVDTTGRINNCGTTSDPEHGMTRVVLTAAPLKPVGSGGWTFEQTGTDEQGHPEGIAVAEPVTLMTFKKLQVVELEQKKLAITAAAESTGWDYTAELAVINAEIEGLK